jgi:hypothetical protein
MIALHDWRCGNTQGFHIALHLLEPITVERKLFAEYLVVQVIFMLFYPAVKAYWRIPTWVSCYGIYVLLGHSIVVSIHVM